MINDKEQAENTVYIFVSNLGVILSSEGENRIDFCRYHKIDKILGYVYDMEYPSADRLTIYTSNYFSNLYSLNAPYLAVLDNRYIQVVKHFDYALPLLQAHGVKIIDKWSNSYLKLIDINRLSFKAIEESVGCRKCVDMNKV